MKKLKGFEGTYYSDRWEHNGQQICKLRDGVYLIFTGKYERGFCGIESEIVRNFSTLEKAEAFINANINAK